MRKSDGSERRNPIRNMIDYIVTRKNMKNLITNSRSNGSINTDRNHKIVIAVIELAKHKLYRTKQKTERKVNVNGSSDIENQNKYKESLKVVNINKDLTPQDKWNKIVKSCKGVGKEVIGKITKVVRFKDPELNRLSNLKQKLKNDTESSNEQQNKTEKNNKIKSIKKQIRKRIKILKKNKLNYDLENLKKKMTPIYTF